MARPGVSIIVPTHGGADRIGPALASVAAQQLDPGLLEVVVVVNGPQDGTADVVRDFSDRHPDLSVVLLSLAEPGVATATNLGLAAASRELVTNLDDDDTLSPSFLPTLLELAGPGVVAHGFVADVPQGGGPADLDTYVNVSVAPFAGRTVHPRSVPAALSSNVAKLVPTAMARAVGYRPDLRLGLDVVHWHHLVDRFGLDVRVADLDRRCLYHRVVRPDSHSRPTERDWSTGVTARLDAIAALAPLVVAGSGRTAPVSRAATLTFARAVGAYLGSDSDQQRSLIAEVARRDLPPMIWRSLNRDRARELVVGDDGLPSAQELATRGALVDVLAPEQLLTRSWRRAAQEWVGDVRRTRGDATDAAWIEERAAARGGYGTVRTIGAGPALTAVAASVVSRRPTTRWVAPGRPRMREEGHQPAPALVAEVDARLTSAGVPAPSGLTAGGWAEHVTAHLAAGDPPGDRVP